MLESLTYEWAKRVEFYFVEEIKCQQVKRSFLKLFPPQPKSLFLGFINLVYEY